MPLSYTRHDAAATFDISDEQFARIAAKATTDEEFVMIWKNEDWWWTDEAQQ